MLSWFDDSVQVKLSWVGFNWIVLDRWWRYLFVVGCHFNAKTKDICKWAGNCLGDCFQNKKSNLPSDMTWMGLGLCFIGHFLIAITRYLYLQDILAITTILLTAPYFLFFCRGFKMIGPFVTMIYKMLVGDLLRFFTIYIIFLITYHTNYIPSKQLNVGTQESFRMTFVTIKAKAGVREE